MPEILSIELPSVAMTAKLGRRRPDVLPQVVPLRNYLLRDIPTPRPVVDYTAKALASIRRVYLNDQLGCCVVSGKMHQIGIWSGNDAAAPVLFTDQDVVRYYSIIGGYVPGNPRTDRGCSIVAALNYMKSTGFNGHKIVGYVGVDVTDKVESQVAIDLFGGVTLGLNLPDAWIKAAHDGAVWGPAQANPNNGHDVCVTGYNDVGVQIATWGMIITITWAAFADKRVVEECYAEVGMDWVGPDGKSPPGVALTQLLADLQLLDGGQIPPLGPPDIPPMPPVPPVPPAPAIRVITVTGTITVDGRPV